MNILQISTQIPYPATDGGKISIYGLTKYFHLQGHKVHLVAYLKERISDDDLNHLRKYCTLYPVKHNLDNNYIDALLNLFQSIPYNISKFFNKELLKQVKEVIRNNSIDIIHVDHLHMAWVIDEIRKITDAPVVLREHNFETRIMRRFAEEQKNVFIKLYAKLQAGKLKKYESVMAGLFSKCIMISKNDEMELCEMNPSVKAVTIPCGVEKELIDRLADREQIIPRSLFHIGSLDWAPNKDGLQWFLTNIFPDIVSEYPDVKLYLYGKNTGIPYSAELAGNIENVGFVKDIWGAVSDKQLAIIPLRIGSGIRIKILELLAAGKNVISTNIGMEGIDVEDGRHLLIADSKKEWINKIRLFFDEKIDSNSLSKNAREKMAENYVWQKVISRFEKEYSSLINKSAKSPA